MAKPRFDDSSVLLNNDLLAGLFGTPATVGLRGEVMAEILVQQYGNLKMDSVVLSPAEFARRNGVEKSNVVRALRELVAFKVLIKVDATIYRINKNYEQYNFTESSKERLRRLGNARREAVRRNSAVDA